MTPTDRDTWTSEAIESAMAPFFLSHETLRTDVKARGARNTLIDREEGYWRVRQILLDPEEDADWFIALVVDLEQADEAGSPQLQLDHIGC